ncbi:hypothetical protein BHYA_0005g00040 [Botrytis hyacinthi]|uniref:Uncharacterized protein n=1 Tax=Botrytis hyacinthi TaxID=278943 RepID=A0A4Z1H7M5_9HELO|nr:hypothetical protein BHYA_0005g00040 [Botrytis hyacinthi]
MHTAKRAKVLKSNDEEKPKDGVPKGNNSTPKVQDSISAIEPNVQTDVSAAPPAVHQLVQCFSEEQIALVLSILKAKSDEISIRDYLNELRESIKLEESQSNRIVDSGEFWKQQFESQRILTDELQTRIASMTSSFEDSEEEKIPSIAQCSSESHKNQPLKSARKKKRNRYDITIPSPFASVCQVVLIRRSLHDESASASCRKLIELSWKAISDCIPKYIGIRETNYHTKDVKFLAHLMSEIVECYKNCVEVSTEHYKTIAGRELVRKSNIIYSLCSFVDKALNEIHRLCITKAKLPVRSGNLIPDRVEISTDNDEPMMVRFVANLMIGVLRKTNWQKENDLHKQIIEGMLAIILNHIGRLISDIVFKEDVAASKLPGSITSGGPSLNSTKNDSSLKSKYFIHILEMALKIQEETMGAEPTEELLEKAKRKIQNTLKNSIIGGGLLGLKMPDQIAEESIDIPELKGLELYGEEWTVQCVFTMIEVDEGEEDEEVRGSGEVIVG